MLRGMGWKETEGIGLKNKKYVMSDDDHFNAENVFDLFGLTELWNMFT